MPCFHPLDAWQTHEGSINFYKHRTSGERRVRLVTPKPGFRRDIKLPCGRCIGCKLDRSKQWAIRLMHEAQLHERTSFITLTYDNNRLASVRGEGPGGPSPLTPLHPEARFPRLAKSRTESPTCHPGDTRAAALLTSLSGTRLTLNYKHVQVFLRALRKSSIKRRGLQGRIRFYMCGEYGDQLGRPHYHLAIFGEDFGEDRYQWRTKDGTNYYRSPLLEKLWPHGNSEIGHLTIESAAYIARYIMKKINGKQADEHYKRIDPNTGETYWLTPEFNVMSRKPGIGKEWMDKFRQDVYPHDFVVMKNQKLKPPRYYDKLLEKIDAKALELIKAEREKGHQAADNTPARLAVRENVTKAKLAFKKRKLESK